MGKTDLFHICLRVKPSPSIKHEHIPTVTVLVPSSASLWVEQKKKKGLLAACYADRLLPAHTLPCSCSSSPPPAAWKAVWLQGEGRSCKMLAVHPCDIFIK